MEMDPGAVTAYFQDELAVRASVKKIFAAGRNVIVFALNPVTSRVITSPAPSPVQATRKIEIRSARPRGEGDAVGAEGAPLGGFAVQDREGGGSGEEEGRRKGDGRDYVRECTRCAGGGGGGGRLSEAIVSAHRVFLRSG